MTIDPQITKEYLDPIEDGLTTSYRAVFYISIYDPATGQPTAGNGVAISYQHFNNGIPGPIYSKNVIGWTQKIDIATYRVVRNYNGEILSEFDIQIAGFNNVSIPDEAPPNTTVCDARIDGVNINHKESAPGANDGQITILAQSSQMPLSYSLDGANYQPSATFSHLHGGAYTAYVSDANGCTASTAFTLPVIQNLLISDPSVDVGAGNLSRWSAAFNPVVFTYQRKDFEVIDIIADGNGQMIVTVNGDLAALAPNDKVFINAGAHKGVYAVTSASGAQIFINSPYVASASNAGFININKLRPYYAVKTEITYIDRANGAMRSIVSTNRPDQTGLVKADISSFLQSLLQVQDGSSYTDVNYRDTNLSASYTIRYAEVWDGREPVYIGITDPYYIIYAAKQLGDAYGGNLAAYVPFTTVNSQTKLAQWVTDFTEPVYTITFPFDIGFIYSEALAGLDIYCEVGLLDRF